MGQRGEKKNKDLREITILWNWCLFQDTIVFETQVNYTYISVVSSPFFTIVSVMQPQPPPPPLPAKKNQNDKANKHILVFQRKSGLFNFQYYWTHH